MKKREDVYFPIYLETGDEPVFPPGEVFIHDALSRINDHAKDYGEVDLTTRHIPIEVGSREGGIARPYYVDRVLLKLYGFKIRWDKTKQQYEMVQ